MTDTVIEHASLAAALVAFQAAVPAINKGKTADTGKYKYTYADLAAIFEAIRPHLAATGLAVTQALVTGSAPGMVGINTTLWHQSGQQYQSIVEFPVGKDPQQIGSAITYFKRYALCALLGIAADDDDDAQVASAPPRQSKPKQPDEVQVAVAAVQAAVQAAGVSPADATTYFRETHNEDSLVKSRNVKALNETADHYRAIATVKDNLGATEAS